MEKTAIICETKEQAEDAIEFYELHKIFFDEELSIKEDELPFIIGTYSDCDMCTNYRISQIKTLKEKGYKFLNLTNKEIIVYYVSSVINKNMFAQGGDFTVKYPFSSVRETARRYSGMEEFYKDYNVSTRERSKYQCFIVNFNFTELSGEFFKIDGLVN